MKGVQIDATALTITAGGGVMWGVSSMLLLMSTGWPRLGV